MLYAGFLYFVLAATGASTCAGQDGFKQCNEFALAVLWLCEELLDSVDYPAEDDFLCAAGDVTFAKFLQQNRIPAGSAVLGVRF